MKTLISIGACTVLLSSVCLAGPEDIDKVMSSITVDSNQQAGDLNDVNGGIHIGDHCSVKEVNTVNGGIDIGTNSKARSLTTVNGSVRLGSGTRISGDATTVNGEIALDNAAAIDGSLTNVNGKIVLTAAQVGKGIETVWGDIEVGKDSKVDGGITVKRPGGSLFGKRPPVIIIGPGATVNGTMKFEHEVKLYVSDRAKIGAIQGAKANVYSGERP